MTFLNQSQRVTRTCSLCPHELTKSEPNESPLSASFIQFAKRCIGYVPRLDRGIYELQLALQFVPQKSHWDDS
jgi:hypothetical protein